MVSKKQTKVISERLYQNVKGYEVISYLTYKSGLINYITLFIRVLVIFNFVTHM